MLERMSLQGYARVPVSPMETTEATASDKPKKVKKHKGLRRGLAVGATIAVLAMPATHLDNTKRVFEAEFGNSISCIDTHHQQLLAIKQM